MYRKISLATAGVLLVGILGCASRQPVETVRVPPRIDLKQHEMIGVVEFDSASAGELGPLTTRRFAELARRDQGLVRMVGCGTRTDALRSVGLNQWDSQTFKALGKEHGVQTILAGELIVSKIRPDIKISSMLRSGQISAWVDATLQVELIEASTGASLWSSSASATHSVGQISVFRGKQFAFDAANPDEAYGGLVDTLVEQVTRDFRETWVRR